VSEVPPKVRAEIKSRSKGWCEAQPCVNRADHLHHRKMRSQGGDHSALNVLAVCSFHHQWIHDHPAQSYENGWLVRSWDTPRVYVESKGPGAA
jgi:hypothetical protein